MFGRSKKSLPTIEIIPGVTGPWQRGRKRQWHTFTTVIPDDTPIRLGLNLVVPSFGVVILQPPQDALIEAQARGSHPEYDQVLDGTLEITLPLSIKKLRYGSIKVGFAIASTLDFGPGRIQEQDELYRREIAVEGGSVLESNNKFDFSMVLPSWLPVQDYHKEMTVLTTLYAVIDGVSDEVGPEYEEVSPRSSGSIHSDTTKRSVSGKWKLSRSKEPSHFEPALSADGMAHLTGRHIAERTIRRFHNPDPEGGVSTLKEQIHGQTVGLGEYDMAFYSDIWTISSLLRVSIAITDIPPASTIFHIEVVVRQNHHIVSPRDGKELKETGRISLMQEGTKPPREAVYPGGKVAALWRGTSAGGKDTGVYIMEHTARVPTDSFIRPTTQPGVKTPMNVAHQLEIDVRFSVHGEDAAGKKLPSFGPGELRVMRISKQLVMPSCILMPDTLTLPLYGNEEAMRLGERSHDPEIPWDACACFLTDAEVEERLRRAAKVEEAEEEKREEAAARKLSLASGVNGEG